MRAAWRLAIRNVSARRRRMGLLGAAVALSSALIAAIACAMAAVNASISLHLESIVGRADISITAPGRTARVPLGLLERVREWDGVRLATGALEAEFPLVIDAPLLVPNREATGQSGGGSPAGSEAPDAPPAFVRSTRTLRVSPLVRAVVDEAGWELRPVDVIAGRLPEAPGEIAIDAFTASRLSVLAEEDLALNGIGVVVVEPERFAQTPVPVPESADSEHEARRINDRQGARLGSTVQVRRLFTEPIELTIVGITARPPLGGRPRGFMTYEGISRVLGSADRVSEIEILLADGVNPAGVIDAHKPDLGENLLIQTTARVTSGVEDNLKSTQLAFILASILALLSASFIILTGLNTDFAERRRELAVLRCIGASKAQLAQSQLLIGLILGAGGAAVGMPTGIGFAALMTKIFEAEVPSGLIVPTSGVLMSTVGTMVAGLLGAAWPAWRTLRMSPLEGLAARATGAPARAILACFIVATILLATHLSLVTFAQAGQGQFLFWSYVFVGLPCLFAGYFLMGVPATWLVTRAASGPASRLLGLPRHVLRRSVQATPFRFGFTAGAMMAGLALMVAIWTEGGAFLRDWLGKMQFPDAFVSGLILPQEAQDKVDSLTEYVVNSVALSVIPVETDAFGVRALQRYQTNFIAFDPDRFFAITEIDWVQGDQETAVARLKEGGAVIVAREFLTAQGMGMGETFTCRFEGEPHEFEIVGVVTSPGLELISKFFNVGDEFVEQAVHGVFGSRRDLKEKFGAEAIQLIQVGLEPDADDEAAVNAMRAELFGMGVLDAGSGRRIKEEFIAFVKTNLLVVSSIAVGSMLIACFGVANLVAAGIHARRFELGVLRAVGGSRSLLARLIGAEACIVAITAGVIGTAMGFQSAWAERVLLGHIIGLELHFRAPVLPVLAGWAVVAVLTLGAALPAVAWLNRRKPRELLAAGR